MWPSSGKGLTAIHASQYVCLHTATHTLQREKDTVQHNAVRQDQRRQDTDSVGPAYDEPDQTRADTRTSC